MRRDEGDLHLAVEPVVKSVILKLEDNAAGARDTRERETRERERR